MEAIIYNQQGKEVGKVTLPERVFGAPFNADLIHQVAQSMQSSARRGTAQVKDRGAVRGGGKKPWRQKGTGRARHGSIRSPLWVGGGVTHGPTNEKNYTRKVNKKMKTLAFRSLLSAKFRDREIIFLDSLALPEIKTKEAKEILASFRVSGKTLLSKSRNAAYIALPNKNSQIEKSFRNIGNVSVGETRNVSVLDLLQYKYIVMVNPEESIKLLARSE